MRLLLVLVLTLAAQQAPRDTPAPGAAATGSGVIKGRVVAADTGTPIRRAAVTIGAPGVVPRTVYTNAAGRYEARNLPPGMYFVSVTPSSYYGQFLPWVPPPLMADGSLRRVPLAAGQTIEWYDLTLPRAGAIVGRVVDEHGEPVSGVVVWAQRSGDTSNRPTGSQQTSDEYGRYRVFRLAPGEYEIVARGSALGGEFVGAGPTMGFVDTYYPGTLSRQESTRIRVRAGQETTAGDLALISARLLRVRGVVTSAQSGVSTPAPQVTLGTENSGLGTSVDPEGRFSFMPQPPGTYRLTARRLSENREATLEFVSMPLTLTDTDVDDIVLTMKPTVTITGRVSFDGGIPPEIPSGALTVRTQRPRRDPYSDVVTTMGTVGPDLTFTLRHLAGELLLRPSGGLPGGWSLKAVLLGSEDITDAAREFRAEDAGRIQIVLSNRWSELSGTVTADKPATSVGGTVVLFSEDRAVWFAESSRMHAARIDREGRFVMRGLRAGRYHVVALPPSVRWDFQQIDKAALERYAAEGTSVTLGDDERRSVDLRLAAGGGAEP